jgi:hypothetical protein
MTVAARFAQRRLNKHNGLMVGSWLAAVAAVALGGLAYDTYLSEPTQVGSTLMIDNRAASQLDVMERRSERWRVSIASIQRAIDNGTFEAAGTGDARGLADTLEAVFEASALEMGAQGQQFDALGLEAAGSDASDELKQRIKALNEVRLSLAKASLFLTEIRTGMLTDDRDMEAAGRDGLARVVSRWATENQGVERFPAYGTTAWSETIGRHLDDARSALAEDMQGVSRSRDSRKGFDRLLP